MGDDVSGMRDDKETEREDDMRREEEENRPRCCLSCRDNIPPKSNSAHKSCGTFFFLFSCNLPPPFPFRVIVALATMANLPFLKQMSHLVGN